MLKLIAGVALVGLIVATHRSYRTMTTALERLKTEVSQSRTLIASAVTMIVALAATIRENVGNEDALNQLADDLDAQQQELAAAVTANTPAEAQAPTPSTGEPEIRGPQPGQIGGPPLEVDDSEQSTGTGDDAPAEETDEPTEGEEPTA